jgi:hypothetical protein
MTCIASRACASSRTCAAKYNIYAAKPLQVGGIEVGTVNVIAQLAQESFGTQQQLNTAIEQLSQYAADSGNQVTLDAGSDD